MKTEALSNGQRTVIDLAPLVVFFAVNYGYGIMVGTAALMVATVLAIGITYAAERSVPVMPTVTCVFVMIFGGLTLIFDDELFIKIKPTIVNLLFAGGLATGMFFGRNLLKIALGRSLTLTDRGWHIMTKGWIAMFVFLAAVNEAVWRSFDTDTWVSFKAFGIPAIVLVFSIILLRQVMQHRLDDGNS